MWSIFKPSCQHHFHTIKTEERTEQGKCAYELIVRTMEIRKCCKCPALNRREDDYKRKVINIEVR